MSGTATPLQATADESIDCFPSLSSLKAAHSELLRRRHQDPDRSELLGEVALFVRRGCATGALLDGEDDRWASQSLLDYWAAVIYGAGVEPLDATLADFDPSLAPALEDADCPYVGLDAFGEEHHRVFFGRQRLVDKLVSWLEGWLQEDRLLSVVGPSGSGKSSLVLAGFLPALKAGAVPGSEDWRYCPPLAPGPHPLANLARLLLPAGTDADEWIQHQAACFEQDAGHLARLVGDGDSKPAVLVIDQFEEIFTLCDDERVRQAFTDNLVGLVQAADARHLVILTMRTDFVPHVAGLPAFQPFFERALMRVPPLRSGELREAVEKPAALVGLKFEEGVVDALLQDILGEPTALPLLQFTLLKLWENRERNRVTWEAYRRLGGAREALARSADELYEGLIDEEKKAARYILLRMVRPGEGLEFTSNRIRRRTLYQAGPARDRVDRVLDKLVRARLVRLSRGETPGDDRVEVAHEALVRNWPRLVDWLEQERETMRRRLRLTAAAEQWEALDRDPAALLRGPLLTEARDYGDLNDLETSFVEASQAATEAEQQREIDRQRELVRAQALAEAEHERAELEARDRKRLLWLAVALFVLLLVAAGLGVFAAASLRNARAAKAHEDSLRLVTQAFLHLDQDPQLGLLLALEAIGATEAIDVEPVPEAEDALRRAIGASWERVEPLKHTAKVNVAAFSDDGRWLATGSEDGMVRLWDVATRRQQANGKHESAVLVLTFSPGGHWLATGSRDGEARIWDLSTPTAAATPTAVVALTAAMTIPHEGEVLALAFCNDGDRLATGSRDGAAYLWDLSQNRAINHLEGCGDGVRVMAFSPVCGSLATAGVDDTVLLREVDTGKVLAELTGVDDTPYRVNALTFSPDGSLLAIAGADGTARLWDMAISAEKAVPKGYVKGITTVAFSPDGSRLATGSEAGMVRLWAVDAPQADLFLLGHKDVIKVVAFQPEGSKLATASADGEVRLWSADSGKEEKVLRGHGASVNALAFAPKGVQEKLILATASSDFTVRLWTTSKEKVPEAQSLADLQQMACGRAWRNLSQVEWETQFGDRPYNRTCQNLPIHLSVVKALLRNGKVDAAANVLRERVQYDLTGEFDPENELARLLIEVAQEYVCSGDVEKALSDLHLAVKHDPARRLVPEAKLASQLVSCWSDLIEKAEYNQARDTLQRAIDVAPAVGAEAAQVLLDLGRGYLAAGSYDQALTAFQQAVELDPALGAGAAQVFLELGRAILAAGDSLQALSAFRQAVDLDPALGAEVARARVRWYVQQGQVEDAVEVLREATEQDPAVALDPEREVARLLIAVARESIAVGDYPGAESVLTTTVLTTTVELDPALRAEAALVLSELGRAYTRAGDPDKGLTTLERAVDLDPSLEDPTLSPEAAQVLLGFAQAHTEMRDYDRALETLTPVVKLAGQMEPGERKLLAEAYNRICWWGSIDLHADQVLQACDNAVTLEPDNGNWRNSRGLARALMEDIAGAIQDFEFFVAWSQQTGQNEPLVAKRQTWIAELEAGRDPFDKVTLEALRDESGEVAARPELHSEAELSTIEGMEYARQGRIEPALAALQRAVDLDPQIEVRRAPSLAEAYNQVCRLGQAQGLVEEVLPACKRAVELATGMENPALSHIVCLNRGMAGLADMVSPACELVKDRIPNLTFGETVTGTVEADGRSVWIFEGTKDQGVTITMDQVGGELDPYLVLLGPGGAVLAEDDDLGVGANSRIDRFALPETGSYTIVARGYDASTEGIYKLTLVEVTD